MKLKFQLVILTNVFNVFSLDNFFSGLFRTVFQMLFILQISCISCGRHFHKKNFCIGEENVSQEIENILCRGCNQKILVKYFEDFYASNNKEKTVGQFQPKLKWGILEWRNLKLFKWRAISLSKGRWSRKSENIVCLKKSSSQHYYLPSAAIFVFFMCIQCCRFYSTQKIGSFFKKTASNFGNLELDVLICKTLLPASIVHLTSSEWWFCVYTHVIF